MIEKILGVFNSIQRDKALHAFLGLVAYSVMLSITGSFLPADLSAITSFMFTASIAVAKEVYDYKYPEKHTSDVDDLLWTVVVPALITLIELVKANYV